MFDCSYRVKSTHLLTSHTLRRFNGTESHRCNAFNFRFRWHCRFLFLPDGSTMTSHDTIHSLFCRSLHSRSRREFLSARVRSFRRLHSDGTTTTSQKRVTLSFILFFCFIPPTSSYVIHLSHRRSTVFIRFVRCQGGERTNAVERSFEIEPTYWTKHWILVVDL